MSLMRAINPRHRGKSRYYFLFRFIEDRVKDFFLLLIVFLSLFFKIKSKGKTVIDLDNYVDIYPINYIVYSLSPKYIFTYNFSRCLSLIRKLGFVNFFKNTKPNFLYKKSSVKVSYNKKDEFYNNRINFNFDYFKPFDQNSFIEMQQNKSIILPYYTRAEFYRKNLFGKYNNLRNKKKIFQILFSGSNHPDWYE